MKAAIVAYVLSVQCFENTTIVAYVGLRVKRYILGTYPTTCNWGTIKHVLIAMACGSCEFLVHKVSFNLPKDYTI